MNPFCKSLLHLVSKLPFSKLQDNNTDPKRQMEQISYTPVDVSDDLPLSGSSEPKTAYKLSIYYESSLYECIVSSDNFNSDFVETDMLESVIQEGLKPSTPNKIDENLFITTLFKRDLMQDTLTLMISLEYKKGKLKRRSEDYSFEMKKKEIDSQATFENVLKGIKKSFNVPIIAPDSTNIFVNIDAEKQEVFYVAETSPAKKSKISLIDKLKIKPELLEFILQSDKKLADYFQSRLNSQESINQKLQEFLNDYFQSEKMRQLLIQYMANSYYTNFIQVLNNGEKILFNVDSKKFSKGSTFHVIKDLESFDFSAKSKSNFRILQEFELKTGDKLEEVYSTYVQSTFAFKTKNPNQEWISLFNSQMKRTFYYNTNDKTIYQDKLKTRMNATTAEGWTKFSGNHVCFYTNVSTFACCNEGGSIFSYMPNISHPSYGGFTAPYLIQLAESTPPMTLYLVEEYNS